MGDTKRGRPRSTAADEAIIAATCELLLELGYERMSIEGVAARAGVGKPTVYRRWTSKSSLVSTAILRGRLPFLIEPPADTGDLRVDLGTWLASSVQVFADPMSAFLIRAATAAAAEDDGTAADLYQRFTRPARDALLARMAAGVAAGQVRRDADLDAAADALIGSLLYRVLTRQGPLDPRRAAGLLGVVISGIAVPVEAASVTPRS